ncbi:MAG: hypothetical protein Greene041662_251, partial [Candidatus Peregrinibacteria bacterium Greene0416_62]
RWMWPSEKGEEDGSSHPISRSWTLSQWERERLGTQTYLVAAEYRESRVASRRMAPQNAVVHPTVHHHAKQIFLYILSGGTGAVVEIVSYLLLLRWGMWYISASVIAFVLSNATAFALHKYIVFKKPDDFLRHLKGHLTVEGFNFLVTNLLLFVLVEYTQLGEEWSKILTMGLGAAWNFLLFKFLVFV